ncbi:MAG: sigma-70 family RNA polymerase sigma factor [Tepidisphaeraceae bacterium]
MIEPARLASLFAEHANACIGYARQFDPCTVDADAVVQEAFVRLMGQRQLPEQTRAWLLATVRRLAIDALRSGNSRRLREQAVAQDRPTWFEADPSASIDARRAAELLRTLPDRQRETVVLRLWSGLTLTQIAELLGVAVSTVHHDYNAALARLRNELEGQTHEPAVAESSR